MESDLLFKGAHVIDPAQDLDGIYDVGVTSGKIAAIGKDLPTANYAEVRDARGSYICPGLVDIHGHWYEGDLYGIDPAICLNHGVTTAIDAGSTGFANFRHFKQGTMETCAINLFAFVHISFMGLLAPFAEELLNLAYARPIETAEVVAQNRDRALGVKIRIGSMTADHGLAALAMATQAAEEARVPLMVHVSKGAEEATILDRLRPGDILTHCFHGRGNRLFEQDGKRTLQLVAGARERGIIFDVGHGAGSFAWETAQRTYQDAFYPDTLSTDLHRYCVSDPFSVTLPSVMSKFLCLGMSLQDVVLKTTLAPARVLGLENGIGTLRVGSRADLLQFDLVDGEFEFHDTHWEKRVGSQQIVPRMVVKDGILHTPGSVSVKVRDFFESDLDIFRRNGLPVPEKRHTP